MTVETAIATRILSLTGITALVADRVRVLKLRQGERSGVRVQQVSEVEPFHLRGTSGLLTCRVQVDSVAPENSGVDPYATANQIDALIKGDGAGSGLSGWAGSIGSPAFEVLSIFPVDVKREYDAGAVGVVKVMRDYLVKHRG